MNIKHTRIPVSIWMKLERASPGIWFEIDMRADHISLARASSVRPHRHAKSWSSTLNAGLSNLFMRVSVLVKNGVWLKHVNDNTLLHNDAFHENPLRVAILIALHELEQQNKSVRLTADEKNDLNKCIAEGEPDRYFFLSILHRAYGRAQKAAPKFQAKTR